MKLLNKYGFIFLLLGVLISSCSEDWLERESKTDLTEDKVFGSESLVNSFMANMYLRLPDVGGINGDMATVSTITDEAMIGGIGGTNSWDNYSYYLFSYYDYGLIKDINYFIEELPGEGASLGEDRVEYYLAEARFIRAYVYFDLVKRMGGVPLITQYFRYENGLDMEAYQLPRSTEDDIYSFVISEMDDIKDVLGSLPKKLRNRASKGACLAVKARAALYAASLAKYNSAMASPISLPGGEVGISADRADYYYNICLEACDEIFNMSDGYSLLGVDESNKTAAFRNVFQYKDDQNPEAIFVRDFNAATKYSHGFTYRNIPRSMRLGTTGGSLINPSLALAESFEYVDGAEGVLVNKTDMSDVNSDYVYYDNAEDIFTGKDPRFFATILAAGASFEGTDLDIQAGLAVWNGTGYTFMERSTFSSNNIYVDSEENEHLITGDDGPSNEIECSQTGFYVHKFLQGGEDALDGRSDIAHMRYRYAEVLLNAAEASFETEDEESALNYINQIRVRAGIEPLQSVTIDQIRHERRVELAFEGHRWFDLIRWRQAHNLFDGSLSNPDAVVGALWPYMVVRPGHETNGKIIYERRAVAPNFLRARYFRVGNYYNAFGADVLIANPLLIKNPFQN